MTDISDLSIYGKNPLALPIEGGCACGQVRYAINAQPVIGLICSCNYCQKLSGTGHGAFLVLPAAAAELQGETNDWTYVADSGGTSTRYFCAQCHAPVYAKLGLHPDGIVVTAASLDDRAQFRPSVALYEADAQGWDRVDPALRSFAAGL
ncbi:MAG: aldehyde-activating protein [Sphingomonadales bacterium]|nr:MAG: aldehyde-activating protein [Sphingomonadales bacterium]TNF03727.1 MAG: aldehyde-activating protein [Sphingomonadales bacterium]